MKNFLKLPLFIMLTIFMVSCNDDDDNGNVINNTDPTIAGFVSDSSDYSTLLAALQRANLVATLDGTANFTVFAPNNAAFNTFLTAAGFASVEDVPVDVLTQILLNHVVDGKVESTQLVTGYINSLASYSDATDNLSMYVDLTSGVKLNGVSSVTTADVAVSNGVIHAVDAVIGLPTVVTFATADPNFSILVDALTANGQPDFVSILSTANGTAPAPFTVFAPTDDAFGDLLTELNVNGLDDIETGVLTATLNSHVIAGANVRAEDLTDGTVGTLGADLEIDATNTTITDPNGRVSNIVAVNVQATNGVIHAIDKVILPQL